MRLQVILLILCGGALGHATAGELEALSEVAPIEDADGKVRDKRQWNNGDFNPNPYGYEDFYPRTWWDNNNANYAPVGGRSGYPPSAGFGNHYEYFGQMHEFYNNLPDARDTGSRSNSFPIALLTYMHRNTYLPPMKQSDTATLHRNWQQYFQQQLGIMPGDGVNVGSQWGGSPQPNQPFGQGPGTSFGSNPGSPFDGNSGRPFVNNPGNGVNVGSQGGGFPQTNQPFGQGPGSSFGSNPGSTFGGNSGRPFVNNPGGNFGGNTGSSGTRGSSGSGSSFGSGSSSEHFGTNSFGAGASSDPFGSSGNSNDQFANDSSHSSDPFLSSNLVKKSADNNAASPAVAAAEFTT